MDNKKKKQIINQLMHHSAHRVGIVYDFTILCSCMMGTGKPYGDNQLLTVTEVNIILEIMRHPGVTSAQLCRKWNRTRGAISQLIKKLESKDLIYKDKESSKREIGLYVTPEGYQIGAEVAANECADSNQLFSALLERGCTQQELEAFYKVMDCYISVLQEGKSGIWRELLPSDNNSELSFS